MSWFPKALMAALTVFLFLGIGAEAVQTISDVGLLPDQVLINRPDLPGSGGGDDARKRRPMGGAKLSPTSNETVSRPGQADFAGPGNSSS